jgi:RES domain-containing protein
VILWRISNYADLAGVGGLTHSGRWHHRGRPVVYLATSAASALLETLVHLEAATPSELPRSYQLLEVELPDDATLRDAPEQSEPDWRQRVTMTRRIGDHWLAAGDTLLLRVPSAVVGRTFNLLFNPAHPQASACRVVSVARFPFDGRLKL